MARFHTLRRCPLTAQFWFLGLDARQGDLTLRGFRKTPTPHGSSLYTLDGLSLHSAGLTLLLPGGPLHFNRRTQTFTRGGRTVPATQGRLHLRAALHAHEAWIADRHGAVYREGLVAGHRPPRPVMGALEPWRMYVQGALAGQTGSRGRHDHPGRHLLTSPFML
ncbi:hypothetical protein [Deinococcus sedimenti]|uniref:Uncharacterized protein n=1 Tax=Deinococcus sedimenti TaxID=1867090 RepID=A0ABQ2RXZ0_9DEIO|nr:hypothetical protein [Deinococcus sedimenti]GGR78131.1 hypothetical protein GCM10008960_01120 [Deinococcus sedimenti]